MKRFQFRSPMTGFAKPIAILTLSIFALQGCAKGWWFEKSTDAKVVQTKTTPATTVRGGQKPRPAKRAHLPIAEKTIDLRVVYLERLLVPSGSEFLITLTGDGIAKPVVSTSLSKGGPPYRLTMDVPEGAKYPLTIDVVLKSTIGHQLSGQGVLRAKPDGTFEIIISTG